MSSVQEKAKIKEIFTNLVETEQLKEEKDPKR